MIDSTADKTYAIPSAYPICLHTPATILLLKSSTNINGKKVFM